MTLYAGHVVVEWISEAGARTWLARIDPDARPPGGTLDGVVRCAGDRAAPCVVRRRAGDQVTWSELDPQTGAIGKLVYQRPAVARAPASAALSEEHRPRCSQVGRALTVRQPGVAVDANFRLPLQGCHS